MIYQERLKKLQSMLIQHHVDAILIEHTIDLFYLTGIELSLGKIISTPEYACLIVDNRYFEMCQKMSPIPVVLSSDSAIKDLLAGENFRAINTLAFDSETCSFLNHAGFQKIFPALTLVPLDSPVKKLRKIKDQTEIAILKQAAELGSQGFDYVCSLLREDVTEEEIAMELEIFWKRLKGKKTAFDPIIAFGTNSSMPHYRASHAQLAKGQNVLIDIGVNLQHYHSDMTRVVFYDSIHPKILEIYKIVQEAQQRALTICRPGITIGELDRSARDFITEKGYGHEFSHSLGHGVGLEIHELPVIRDKHPFKDERLEPGMVITIEPGIYLSALGGVRIEDTVVITEDGHINLTQRSKDPIVIKNK